ncbi:aspartate-semialdehyde dehydrogenase [Neoehrlichia mikurensis]|uniref:Aspartate-semialdehyde dehydrogenase n=1 Tax=Neoehrlichia mikurensis TaxID=89586 RepID=A0A9Q9C0E7_9RICK|nr:aspartate-semialdehyde dehydrogenase [Neoehrlichia mikurensis]QXK92331.1 aspartate-semialdehyde dehydrogenase [Neoehrlichia mikurensis]QXK92785.1 aspartate-semialdehyde dehydrogenase [Neoehrlichia mikurensis]QXK94026.1 aspartate-semialdehyde dehydrogenase [Neoehrlichia mikurensis]UTO55809.1 aspartate-semialdehyde dehydrogenase [Neoehrlichia mikurensis]UTO56724.1 aspartate-semialdehyde dehydrogenase [Neoehrlichia mikurensis]
MSCKIAIVGATGNVGRVAINILAQKSFPVENVIALASKKSFEKKISYGKKEIISCGVLDGYDFSNVDVAIFATGSSVAEQYVEKVTSQGCIVIDNSSLFRMNEDVPLIVPEVNSHDIQNYKKKYIISNPNCSTIQMVMVLNPLHQISKIKRVVVSTYQSTSGAGKAAMDELYNQTKGIFMNKNIAPKQFTKQIAFNCIPHIDVFLNNGSTKEEWKMQVETQKILDKEIQISATCVRVPVFVSHSESLNIEFTSKISEQEAIKALEEAPGILVLDRRKDKGYATPIDCVNDDYIYVSRIRKDNTVPYGLSMWVVGDNLRKGAALNAVQILEILIRNYL